MEVLATALRHKVDVLALTETRSRTQGRVEGEDYDLWESGANRAEGKALLVHTRSPISAEPEAVNEDVFVLTVGYRKKDLIRVVVVYATPDRPEREVLDGLQDVVHRYPGPLVLLGDFSKDAHRRPMYQDRLRMWGYTAYPTGWTWTRRGAGAHAHERSMIHFILAPSDMQVAQVQVLGRIPVRTDHRMVLAEVQIKGTYRMAPMGATTAGPNVTLERHSGARATVPRRARPVGTSVRATPGATGPGMGGGDHGDTSESGGATSLPHRGTSRSVGVGRVDGAQAEMAGAGGVPRAATSVPG